MRDGPADDQLLRRAQSGDEQAFAELVERHGRYLFGIAHASLRSDHDAEDAVQETLLAALRARFDGASAVRTWLVAILVRQVALVRRKRKRWSQEAEQPPPPPAAGEASAVDARLDLSALLGRLAPEHREVIVLRELQHLSYEQIAATLNIPRGTVESRLHRARQHLREMLGRS